MDKIPLTRIGHIKIKEQLQFLKSKERPRISNSIAEARAHGDLKENAEYHAAKEEQALLEKKISEIENALSMCQVIDVSEIPYTGKVIFGSTVKLFNLAEDKELKYKIVGNLESDPSNGYISIDTPIAKAIIGKNEGEIVEVMTPSGKIELEIELVEHI
ncbi:transcription elongation factor GreA [SAR86 cluster bacterium]|jgi:transcription elongation factor GreA|nr:transcription elongation factor GreA [SAR86 cluster bacterium]|tara:strand:- start:268 stop:744 length:477 start_codon:yes stop_codon:yes gene_type:complete